MKKETKPETPRAEAQTAVATLTPPVPVDPVAVLEKRKQQKRAAAWQQARALILAPELSEADVCRLADLLEEAGLPPDLITVFRMANELRASATATGRDVERLAGERQAAEKKLEEAQAELRSETDRLETAIRTAYQVVCDAKVKQGVAVDARNLVENLSTWFAPLFDADKGVSDFALPQTIAPSFPSALRDALAAAGLLDGQQRPTALTQPIPERVPPARRGPVLECSHGPGMALERPSSAKSAQTINGVPVDGMGQPIAAARPPARDLAGRLIPTQLTQPNDRR
jgi:hypothetical protein